MKTKTQSSHQIIYKTKWQVKTTGWVIVVNRQLSNFFQLYNGENKLIFKEMMMKFPLFNTNRLGWILIVLAYWNRNLQVDMSLHFRSN